MVFNKTNSIKSLVVALLLGAYVFTILHSSLHPFFSHAHQAHETCSAESEKDPCHKRIYHHDFAAGCQHDAHIHSPKHICELCDALVNIHVLPKEKALEVTELVPVKQAVYLADNSIFRLPYLVPSPRGPPVII